MTPQSDKAEAFHTLHIKGSPLVLYNVWDAGSARAVAAAGAKAIATGSASVAMAHGFPDGEALPRGIVLANVAGICAAVEAPVTLDFETGYGKGPEEVQESVALAIAAGVIGVNLEDGLLEKTGLRETAAQCARLQAARAASDLAAIRIFINARIDSFLVSSEQSDAILDDALARARAYQGAGANGIFLPGLTDERLIARATTACPLPVNIMMKAESPSMTRLAALGVARVSFGPGPYLAAMESLSAAARHVYAGS
jgi:2-methylisocitrate lyase-like PEP mutase family enzyme